MNICCIVKTKCILLKMVNILNLGTNIINFLKFSNILCSVLRLVDLVPLIKNFKNAAKKWGQLVFVDTTFSMFYFYIEGFLLQKKYFYSKSSICDKNQKF